MNKLVLIIILMLTFLPARTVFSDPSDIAVERIQKAYEGIKDMKGSFIQKSYIKALKRTDTYKGTFIIKLPSMLRWQYKDSGKHDAEVIIKQDEMIVYQKNEKQAFKSNFSMESYGHAPIALLSGLGNIKKEFDVSRNDDDKLVLKPKNRMSGVAYIEIMSSGDGFPISALSIIDKRSNRIEITLGDVVLNSGIKDSAFDFSLPKGVSLYEHKAQ